MRALQSALSFLVGTTLRPAPTHPGTALELVGPGGWRTTADLYEPRHPPRGLILFVHGMSPLAHRDPRMCRAGWALAQAGFRVILPLIPDFQALRIRPDSAAEVAACVQALAAHPRLGGERPFGLMSVCYSAGVSFAAAARPEVGAALSVIGSIGTWCSMADWGSFLLTRPEADAYARCIVLLNHFEVLTGPRPGVREGLHVALLDDWHRRDPPELPAFAATLGPEDQALLAELLDPARTVAFGARLAEAIRPRFQEMDLLARVPQLRTPAVLLHAADDLVVPPQGSVALHQALCAAGVPSRLVVSPALGHAALQTGIRGVPEVARVVAAFAEIFARSFW